MNPFVGVIVTVIVPLCPADSASEFGEIATEKSGGGKLMVYVAKATGLLR